MDRAGSPPPADYAGLLSDLEQQVRTSRAVAMRAANADMLRLYWTVGRTLLGRQQAGSAPPGVIDRLARDLHAVLPGMTTLTPANLGAMQAFAAA
jgi:hypothetical protein